MARVVGIGGVFFKSKDSKKLAAWYRDHLKIPLKDDYATFAWRSSANSRKEGHTVFSIFPRQSSYFGKSSATFMINFRVENLEKVLSELRREGVKVDPKVEVYPYGRFGWVTDPDGNRIELWEPPAKHPSPKNVILSA